MIRIIDLTDNRHKVISKYREKERDGKLRILSIKGSKMKIKITKPLF